MVALLLNHPVYISSMLTNMLRAFFAEKTSEGKIMQNGREVQEGGEEK